MGSGSHPVVDYGCEPDPCIDSPDVFVLAAVTVLGLMHIAALTSLPVTDSTTLKLEEHTNSMAEIKFKNKNTNDICKSVKCYL